MKSIKFLAVLFAAILMTLPIFAQRSDKADRGHREHGMMKALDLTDAQKEQAKTIREAYRPKFEALRNQDADIGVMREKKDALRTEQEAELRKILTADQNRKLDAHKAERDAKRKAFKSKMKNVDKEGMKDEMKAYKKQNIKPILLEQRKKLEPQISAADQAEIKELRVAMNAAKKEMKVVKDKYKDTRADAPRGSRKGSAARTEVNAIKDRYADKYEAAKALADKYDTQIMALYAEVEGKKAQWDADIKVIKDKYFADIKEEFGKHPRSEKSHEGKGKRGGHKRRRGHANDKVDFLLMDVK